MVTAIKFIAIALSAGLFYLIARFTDEYLHPYKRGD